MSNTKKQTLTLEQRNALKMRVLKISENLGKDYLRDIMSLYPQYNNGTGKKLLMDVKLGLTANEEITVILEKYSENKLILMQQMSAISA